MTEKCKNEAMKKIHSDSWSQVGQDMIEYLLILVLSAVVMIVILALVGSSLFGGNAAPAKNASMLEIVRYCEKNARTTSGKITYDAPEKFIDCMAQYEYSVKR